MHKLVHKMLRPFVQFGIQIVTTGAHHPAKSPLFRVVQAFSYLLSCRGFVC